MQKIALQREHRKLRLARMHHRLVVDALLQREGTCAEARMREHAHIGVRYGACFGLDDDSAGSPEPRA